ncbi:hypothetical protein KVT40_002192 [Elsinoe batatas]|uniref:A-kinase anchor protein 7-like phosphoesterase domain-containing protein n=1 Tax=Elsinoe batatas TaxID=2601811 RepID=A0A8K0L9H2_9PEZI|nr:hypothetical protein KVT40_002192 [Elsinoe batatas]
MKCRSSPSGYRWIIKLSHTGAISTSWSTSRSWTSAISSCRISTSRQVFFRSTSASSSHMPRRGHGGDSSKSQQGKKPALTHFLCLPLVGESSRPELEESLGKFRLELSGDGHGEEDTPHVPAGAIRPVGSIHLTLGVMSLKEEGRLDEAVKYLQSLNIAELFRRDDASTTLGNAIETSSVVNGTVSEAHHASIGSDQMTKQKDIVPRTLEAPISPPPVERPDSLSKLDSIEEEHSKTSSSDLRVDLTSLYPMQSAKATTILYASPSDPTDRLYSIADKLRNLFTDAGFLLPDTRLLKLHATIVNTIYVKARDRAPPAGPSTNSKPAASAQRPPATDPRALQDPHSDSVEIGETITQIHQSPAHETPPSLKKKHTRRLPPLKLDARSLIEKYKDHIWARDVAIDRVAICEMGAKNVLNDKGEVVDQVYQEVASISLLPR